MQIRNILLSIILTLSLIGCASYDFSRRTVEQGNLLPQSTINHLKLGMSKEDVSILMGTSLLSPMFTLDRWDYAYTRRQGNGPTETRHVSLFFAQGTLRHIEHQP